VSLSSQDKAQGCACEVCGDQTKGVQNTSVESSFRVSAPYECWSEYPRCSGPVSARQRLVVPPLWFVLPPAGYRVLTVSKSAVQVAICTTRVLGSWLCEPACSETELGDPSKALPDGLSRALAHWRTPFGSPTTKHLLRSRTLHPYTSLR